MQDDGTDDAQADDAPSLRFVALSLRDGLDAERVYHKSSGRDLSNPQSLQVRFLRALRTGQVDAIGYLPPRLPDFLPVLIPADAWDQCRIEWDSAELHGAGFHFVDVRILMSVCVFERHNLFYLHQPVAMLAPFPPSDDKRVQLKLPAKVAPLAPLKPEPTANKSAAPRNKPGPKSLRDKIRAAFHVIEKNREWEPKELTKAIYKQVKSSPNPVKERGLTHRTMFDHVRDLWTEFLSQPPS